METKFSRGPWKWYWRETDGEADCGVFWEESYGMAYSICRAPRYVTRAQWEKLGPMLAAAPDLLEVLEAFPGLCAIQIDLETWVEDMQAVIAKAKGIATQEPSS